MRSSRKNVYVVASLSLLAALCIVPAFPVHALAGQIQQPGASPGLGTPMPAVGAEKLPEPPAGPDDAHMRRVQETQAMDERHKKMESDADKLLKLATDLKFEVDHATKNETSVSAYLKADQIEKLAHDVKQRLKN